MILQKNLSYKMKEKLCEERRFGVFKTLKTQELLGHCPLDPRQCIAPGPHQGSLSEPLDPTPLRRSARFTLIGHKLFLFSTPQ